MSNVKPIPSGCHSLNTYLCVRNSDKAIDFYKKAFGAQEVSRMIGPDGKVMHAELRIGDSILMLSDEFPEMGNKSPQTLGGSACTVMLYTENVDSLWDQAVKAGAEVKMPLNNMFWGDRFGSMVDPFGHNWSMAQHIEDVSPEEMKKRQEAFFKQQMAGSKK
jgi:PhnB protein